MGRKESTTEWYFDIINPVLAEICRKNKIAVYITANMIQSKGNMPYSLGTAFVREPRIVEARTGWPSRMTPGGGSIALWFAEMCECAKITTANTADVIRKMAPLIDAYTYYYDIEQVHSDPFSDESYVAVEKRIWNAVREYRLDELDFKRYRTQLSIARDEAHPLARLLYEKPIDVMPIATLYFDRFSRGGTDDVRKILFGDTEKQYAAEQACTIPSIDTSDELSVPILGTAFSVTSISGKEKTAITEYIKRNGGTVAEEYSPKTTVFITKQISEEAFIKENSSTKRDLVRIARNSLMNGIIRKTLGEKVSIVLEEDFWKAYKTETETETEEVPVQKQFNEQGDLILTMAQAELDWTVKATATGYCVKSYKGTDEVLYVPAYIDGKPVEVIDKGKKNKTVKKIIIPDTVKRINGGAFPDYNQLEGLVFKNENTTVSGGAFTGCPLMLDDNQCFVANGVLQDCRQAGDVVIPENVRVIPDNFAKKAKMSNISTLTILDGTETIGWTAFEECNELTQIIIGDTVQVIFNGAFADCKTLKNVSIGKSIKRIEYAAFYGCKDLTDIHFNGTKEQWYRVGKANDWNYDTGFYTVHCLDGTLSK